MTKSTITVGHIKYTIKIDAPAQSDACPDDQDARDLDVTVTAGVANWAGGITLWPNAGDHGHYDSCGTSLDVWCSDDLRRLPAEVISEMTALGGRLCDEA